MGLPLACLPDRQTLDKIYFTLTIVLLIFTKYFVLLVLVGLAFETVLSRACLMPE